mgnify:CR=1 FL=1
MMWKGGWDKIDFIESEEWSIFQFPECVISLENILLCR